MEKILLYCNRVLPTFAGVNRTFEESKYVIIGVPFDSGSTYKPGSRFGPGKIREASQELESFDPILKIDFEDLLVTDLGDIPLYTEPHIMINTLAKVIEAISIYKKTPVIIGGDHTISIGSIRSLKKIYPNLKVIIFDAHLDLRDTYPDEIRVSHATVIRRIIEELDKDQIIIVGARAISKEEYTFVLEKGIKVFWDKTPPEFPQIVDPLYLSIDIDVLDPSFAPGVGSPEPNGQSPDNLINSIKKIIKKARKIVGFDIVEVNPLVDINDITSSLAAWLIEKILLFIETYTLRAT